jgi:hypothetical protein
LLFSGLGLPARSASPRLDLHCPGLICLASVLARSALANSARSASPSSICLACIVLVRSARPSPDPLSHSRELVDRAPIYLAAI